MVVKEGSTQVYQWEGWVGWLLGVEEVCCGVGQGQAEWDAMPCHACPSFFPAPACILPSHHHLHHLPHLHLHCLHCHSSPPPPLTWVNLLPSRPPSTTSTTHCHCQVTFCIPLSPLTAFSLGRIIFRFRIGMGKGAGGGRWQVAGVRFRLNCSTVTLFYYYERRDRDRDDLTFTALLPPSHLSHVTTTSIPLHLHPPVSTSMNV